MVIVMKENASQEQIRRVTERIEAAGLRTSIVQGQSCTLVGVIGDKRLISTLPVEVLDGVEKVLPVTDSYKLASRQFRPEATVIDIDGIKVGGGNLVVMAGPCAVESREQLLRVSSNRQRRWGSVFTGRSF